MRQSIIISASMDAVFDLLTDLANYAAWLPSGGPYMGTTLLSHGPTVVGTSYIDRTRWLSMRGTVIELEPPRLVAFHERAHFGIGRTDAFTQYTLEPSGTGTRVTKEVALRTHGLTTLLRPITVSISRKEISRVLKCLKRFAEA